MTIAVRNNGRRDEASLPLLAIGVALFLTLLALPGLVGAQTAADDDDVVLTRIRALEHKATERPDLVLPEIQQILLEGEKSGISPENKALARAVLAGTYFYSGKYMASLTEMEDAGKELAARGKGDSDAMLELLSGRAQILTVIGREDEALPLFEGIHRINERRFGTKSRQFASSLYRLGDMDLRKGRYQEGEQKIGEANRILERSRDVQAEDRVIYRLAWARALQHVWRPEEAVKQGQLAVSDSERYFGPNSELTARALSALGGALMDVARYADSEVVLRRSLSIRQGNNNNPTGIYESTYLLASVLLSSKKIDEAQSLYQHAFELASKLDSLVAGTGPALALLGWATASESNGVAALEVLKMRRRAVGLFNGNSKQGIDYAYALGELAESMLVTGDAKGAQDLLKQALPIAQSTLTSNDRNRIRMEMAMARALHAQGDPEGYRYALKSMEKIRTDLLGKPIDSVLLPYVGNMYLRSLIDFAELAVDQGHPDAAFEALQLANLGDMDSAGAALVSRASGRDAILNEQLREFQDVSIQGRQLQTQRAAALSRANSTEVQRIDAEISANGLAAEALAGRIQERMPSFAGLIRPQPATLESVRARLKDDDALLMTAVVRSGALSILITRREVIAARVPMVTGEMAGLIGRVRQSINAESVGLESDSAFDVGAAYALYQAVLPPKIGREAGRATRLIVQANGGLAMIPFGLLVTQRPASTLASGVSLKQAKWLIRRQSVETAVSLQTLLSSPRKSDTLRFAGIGAPALTGSPGIAMRGLAQRLRSGTLDARSVRELPALPETEGELARMKAALGGNGRLITGNEATEETLRTTDLSKYNVLAFATHGLVSGELRGLTEPGLVLTPAANDDGVFTASDVAKLKLNADWVILSACDTATGETANAPMYSGLARAFVYAGTRSLLLSHWQVRDDIASRLTVETVKASRRGMHRAEALRQAQLRLINDKTVKGGAHPALWAPFVLLGN